MKNVHIANLVFNDFRNDSRVEKICRSSSLAGYEVTIFAFGGSGLPVFEDHDGWRVIRSGGSGRILRLVCLAWNFVSRVHQFSIVHCNDLEPLPLAFFAKILRFGRIGLIYDAHELETEKLALRGLRKFLSRLLERVLIPFVDEIITVSDSIAAWYAKTYRIESPAVVYNAPSRWNLKQANLFRKRFNLSSDTILCLYLGGFQKGRAIEIMLDAFSGVEGVALILMGFGSSSLEGKRLEALVREKNDLEENVFFHEPVNHDELADVVASADVGLCLIQDECLSYRYCLPNKFFEYGMAGLPIIVSDLPEMRDKIEHYSCGVVCPNLSPEGIRIAVEGIVGAKNELWGQNARRMAEEHCWEEQKKKLLDIYDSMLELA